MAVAEADAQARAEEDQVLMTIKEASNDHEVKATRIFYCLMKLGERIRQEAVSDSDVQQDVSSSSNTFAAQE